MRVSAGGRRGFGRPRRSCCGRRGRVRRRRRGRATRSRRWRREEVGFGSGDAEEEEDATTTTTTKRFEWCEPSQLSAQIAVSRARPGRYWARLKFGLYIFCALVPVFFLFCVVNSFFFFLREKDRTLFVFFKKK